MDGSTNGKRRRADGEAANGEIAGSTRAASTQLQIRFEEHSLLRRELLELAGIRDARRIVLLGDGCAGLEQDVQSMATGSVSRVRMGAGEGGARMEPDQPAAEADLVAFEQLLCSCPDAAPIEQAVHEALRPGGCAVIAAEPDWTGVMEHPPGAQAWGLVAGVLVKQGARLDAGRQLRTIFRQDRWDTVLRLHEPTRCARDVDPEALVGIIRGIATRAVSASVLDRWEAEMRRAWTGGTLLAYVPHFAMMARKR